MPAVLFLAVSFGSVAAGEVATNSLLASQTRTFDPQLDPMCLHTKGKKVLDAGGIEIIGRLIEYEQVGVRRYDRLQYLLGYLASAQSFRIEMDLRQIFYFQIFCMRNDATISLQLSRNDLEQCRLARTILPDKADFLASPDSKAHIAQDFDELEFFRDMTAGEDG